MSNYDQAERAFIHMCRWIVVACVLSTIANAMEVVDILLRWSRP